MSWARNRHDSRQVWQQRRTELCYQLELCVLLWWGMNVQSVVLCLHPHPIIRWLKKVKCFTCRTSQTFTIIERMRFVRLIFVAAIEFLQCKFSDLRYIVHVFTCWVFWEHFFDVILILPCFGLSLQDSLWCSWTSLSLFHKYLSATSASPGENVILGSSSADVSDSEHPSSPKSISTECKGTWHCTWIFWY